MQGKYLNQMGTTMSFSEGNDAIKELKRISQEPEGDP